MRIERTEEELLALDERHFPKEGHTRVAFDWETYARLEGGANIPYGFRSSSRSFFRGTDAGAPPRGVNRDAAFHIQSWDYKTGGNLADFRRANERLYRNLRALGVPFVAARAAKAAASVTGVKFFNWKPGCPSAPQEHLTRAHEFSAATGARKDLRVRDLVRGAYHVSRYRRNVVYVAGVSSIVALMGAAWWLCASGRVDLLWQH